MTDEIIEVEIGDLNGEMVERIGRAEEELVVEKCVEAFGAGETNRDEARFTEDERNSAAMRAEGTEIAVVEHGDAF